MATKGSVKAEVDRLFRLIWVLLVLNGVGVIEPGFQKLPASTGVFSGHKYRRRPGPYAGLLPQNSDSSGALGISSTP